MKKIIIVLLLSFVSLQIFSQEIGNEYQFVIEETGEGFVLKQTEKANDINNISQQYIDALQNANFDKYRMNNDNRILLFNNGIQVSLLSAVQLREQGFEVRDVDNQSDLEKIHGAIFKLSDTGYILETHVCAKKLTK